MAAQSLSAAAVLEVWERGANQSPLDRALELVSAACPETPRETWWNVSVGRRDAALFVLRERMFGPEMSGLANCPQCNGRVELTLNASDVRSVSAGEAEGEVELSIAGYDLRFRPPTSRDLEASRNDPADGETLILQRCLVSARYHGAPTQPDFLPQEVVEAVMDGMAKADPLADVRLAISCPLCGHEWRAAFDIVSFLWSEIEAAASRLLYEVHRLASAYGWGERDILALSPARRQCYLAMVGE